MEDISTKSEIAKILEILGDGKWHTMQEIRQKIRLKENQIQQILKFLSKYNFIIMDETKGTIKLEEKVQRFFTLPTTS